MVVEITDNWLVLRKIIPSIILATLFCIACIAVKISDPSLIANLRGSGFDTLQRVWPRQNTGPQLVTVVDIDEASLKTKGQWPWPRRDLAELINRLSALGASAIVFDMVFPEVDRMGEFNDIAFANAIKDRPVITAFASSQGEFSISPKVKASFATTGNPALAAPPRLSQLTQNLSAIDEAAAGIGSMNIDLAINQGITREIPLLLTDGENYFPSLNLEALRVAQGENTYVVNASPEFDNVIESIRVGEIEIPTSDDAQMHIYYRHHNANEAISAAQILGNEDVEKLRNQIEGKIVLIGTSAVGLLDMRTSALGEAIPGVSAHAQALEQILQNQFLLRPQWVEGLEIWLAAILSLIIAFLSATIRPIKSMLASALMLSGLTIFTAYSFSRSGILFDLTWASFTLIGTYILSTAYRLLVTDRDGRKLRNAFGHYVAPTILSEIERNPSALKLGGEQRDVTVMFVDIENFTPLSESLPPEKLVQLVNSVLQICSSCILAEGGTIDKYIGDAVMAFWNAPLRKSHHQYHACKAALNIQAELQDYMFEQHQITVRIGIASGPAIVGNMGSAERFNYSVMGETVNTAARAEQSCKAISHNIAIAGNLDEKTKTLTILPAGQLALKGITQRTAIFSLISDEKYPSRDALQSAMSKIKTTKANCERLALEFPTLANFFRAIPARAKDFGNYNIKP